MVGSPEHLLRVKEESFEILLRPRSMLVFAGGCYSDMMHGIAAQDHDTVSEQCINCESAECSPGDVIERRHRISLTVRHVPIAIGADHDAMAFTGSHSACVKPGPPGDVMD